MAFVYHHSTDQVNVAHFVWMQTPEWYWEDYMLGHTYQLYLNVPTISHSAYNAREREVGCYVEAVVKESCEKVICEEKKYNQIEKDGVVEMDASYDMG